MRCKIEKCTAARARVLCEGFKGWVGVSWRGSVPFVPLPATSLGVPVSWEQCLVFFFWFGGGVATAMIHAVHLLVGRRSLMDLVHSTRTVGQGAWRIELASG